MALIDLQIAARSLAQHRKRSLFLGLATGSVTALLVLLVAFTDGLQENLLSSGTTLMTGHVNVGGFFKVTAGTSAPLVTDYQTVLSQVRPLIPELDYAVARGRGYAKAVAETGSMDLVLGGLIVETEDAFKKVISPVEGKVDDLAKPGTLLLFQSEAKRLGVRVGDAVTLSAPTYRGMANTADVRVAVIARDAGVMSYFNAYVPFSTLQSLYQLREGATGAIHLYLKDHRASLQVAERLREALTAKGHRVMDPDPQPYWMKLMFKVNKEDWTGQKLDVSTWNDELSIVKPTISMVEGITVLLLFVLICIVSVGVMSTMWIAIRERTREIGTMRAIGMHRRRVLLMFLTEAFLLGLLSTVGGALLGAVVATMLNALQLTMPEVTQAILMNDRLYLAVHPGTLVSASITLTLATTLAALIPSFFAARLKPITAMHHIG